MDEYRHCTKKKTTLLRCVCPRLEASVQNEEDGGEAKSGPPLL